MGILHLLWEAKYLTLLFILLTISSTHLIVQGMLLDKSKGDSMSLVYLNMLIALPIDYLMKETLTSVTIAGASILILCFLGCEMLASGC